MKKCTVCDLEKDNDQFNKNRGECKICQKKWKAKYYKNNKQKISKSGKRYRDNNKTKIKERSRRYYLNNKDTINKKSKEYEEKNKQKMQDYRKQYYLDNKEQIIKKQKDYLKNNDQAKIKHNLRCRINQLIKGKIKSGSTIELLGCEVDFFIKYIESKFSKGMTWDNHTRDGWHIDHIIPCASFDLTDPEQQKKCFHYSNLQPLWAVDNLRKSDRILANEQ